MNATPSPSTPGDYGQAFAYQEGREAALVEVLKIAAESYVLMAAPLWRLGDGFGGWAIELVVRAALDVGLPAPVGDQPAMSSRVGALAERDGWCCRYCGAALGWGHPSVARPEVDHVVPRCQGGTNRLDNLALACPSCNNAKGGRTPEQWRAAQAARAGR